MTFSLRPVQAHWFETYLPHEQTVRATEILAQTGVVELDIDPRLSTPLDTDKLRYFVQRARDIIRDHSQDLPSRPDKPGPLVGNPVHLANRALHRLRLWSARLDYVKEQLAQRQSQRQDAQLLDEALGAMRRGGHDWEGLFGESRFLCKCLFACPKTCHLEDSEVAGQRAMTIQGPRHDFYFMLGLPDQRTLIQHLVVEQGCDQIGLPSWLTASPDEAVNRLAAQIRQLEQESARLEQILVKLRTDPEIATSCLDIDTLAWYLDQVARYLHGQEVCHVTGWSTAADPGALQQALWHGGVEAIVRYPEPPPTAVPPVATLQSWWAQPTQPLLVLWGTPDHQEVDPSGLLALLVPSLFGYMFPDLGHGLLLALLALVLGRRWPEIRFLLPCGISAMVFGLVFGEVFGFDDLLPPLWLKPLEQPILVLALPLVFGVGLLLLGLVFSGLEAHWQGTLGTWLKVDGAVLILYLTLLAALVQPLALYLAALALLHYLIGSLWRGWDQGLLALPAALGRLLFSVFELMLNTLSFARVGAFALAHAAFSHSILTLADTVANPLVWGLTIILGNVFAVVLEGLVVFVQTTRLVLFEFFVHFLRAEGRLFRPLRGP